MINIELIYKFGLNSPVDLNFDVREELLEFKKFVKNIPNIFFKLEVYQNAILKSYYVYHNISSILKSEGMMNEQVVLENSRQHCYIDLQLKAGYIYSSLIEFYIAEIDQNSILLGAEVKKLLVDSVLNFDAILCAKQIEENTKRVN